MSNSNTHVIVGMSGGVDSSVAALLLQQQGYHVEGLFMKNWEEDDGTEYCTAKEDLADARKVCDKLGIKLHSANFAAEYWDNVFEHFLAEYRAGRTPNPDILCNKEIKFKAFLDYAQVLGADFIDTGHYARTRIIESESGRQSLLLKGLDPDKDQSYFLHAVSSQQFAKTLFPVGEMLKPKVREIAHQHDLATYAKKDSTGICFIGERRFKDFLEQYIPAQPGEIRSVDGDLLGNHNGLMFHTIGQRQGLGIGGISGGEAAPWYVVEKDLSNNTLIVAQGKQHPMLFSRSLSISHIDWIDAKGPQLPFRCKAKTRYRQSDQDCVLEAAAGDSLHRYVVRFDKPQRAVTPGQSCVFYAGEVCLGGGIIEARDNEHGRRTD